MSLQNTTPSNQFDSHAILQSSQSLWSQPVLNILPWLPPEIRIDIYKRYLLASPWHLNHPRVTEYEGRNLALGLSRHAHHSLGHTFITTCNDNERLNAKPTDFGLTWYFSGHDAIKNEANLYHEHIFKITWENIGNLRDWTPPLPLEKYKRIVLRIQPSGFYLMPGAYPPVNPAIQHQNLGLRQWSSRSPNTDAIMNFLAKFTSLYSLHVCIEDEGHTPTSTLFMRWFGSNAIKGPKKQLNPFKDAVDTMYTNPTLNQVPWEQRCKVAILSARKTITDRGMSESSGYPFVPSWLPGENSALEMVKTEVSVRIKPPAGREEREAANSEANVVRDWEGKWLGRAREERQALVARGEKVCVACGWRNLSTWNPWVIHDCAKPRWC